jgi:AraC-like DNA-binding protein
MEPRPKFERFPDWLARAYTFPGLYNVLSNLVRIPCSIAPLLPGSHWAVLYNQPETATIGDLENAFGKVVARQKYNLRNWDTAERTKRAYLSELWGFSDLTVPVLARGKVGALLCSGPFLRKPPDAAALERAFRNLSGRPPRRFDPTFAAFVQLALRMAVLDGPRLRAYRAFLELAAEVVAGRGNPTAQLLRMQRLSIRHLAKLPQTASARVAQMIDPVKYAQWKTQGLEYYDRDELGISHLPNMAIAVMRVASEEKRDLLTMAIELGDFQLAYIEFARTLHETLSTRLPDQGSFVLTWLNPKLGRGQKRTAARKLAEKLTEFARRKLSARVAIGIGGFEADGLPECARQAVVAMQLAGHDEVPLLFYDDIAANLARDTGHRSVDAERRLVTAYFDASREDSAAIQAEYVHRVLEESLGIPAVARTYFEHCLRSLLERSRAQGPLEEKTYSATVEKLTDDLARAQSTTALVAVFRQWVVALGELRRQPSAMTVQLRLQRAADYVRERCQDNLKLETVARQSGLSPAYFSHLFKATFGSGFARYLVDCRLDRARRLLAQTQLPIARVVAECGFGSLAHFHSVFKSATGSTPGQFRAKAEAIDEFSRART